MKRILLALSAAFICSFTVSAQDFSYRWVRIPVSETYDEPSSTRVSALVDNARAGMSHLFEVIAYSEKELASYTPESPLSNMTADIVRIMSAEYTGTDVDCAFYNMGGIRTVLPKGQITVNDIVGCYPFRNTLVVAEMTGAELLRFYTDYVRRGTFQAVSGVEMSVDTGKGELLSLKVAGKDIDPDKLYRMATISFLLNGGDDYRIADYAVKVTDTGVQVKDAMIAYMRELTDKGLMLNPETDGRVVLKGTDNK